MAYVLITITKGQDMDNYRQVAEKVGTVGVTDGLIAHAVGADEDGLHVTDVWESHADADRFGAERLFPVFASLGMTDEARRNTTVTSYETEDLYVRP